MINPVYATRIAGTVLATYFSYIVMLQLGIEGPAAAAGATGLALILKDLVEPV